jgi:CRISPR-associated protein Cas1
LANFSVQNGLPFGRFWKGFFVQVPWYVVSGFGAHLKATRNALIIQKNGKRTERALDQIDHLLVMGGHSLHTSVITAFLRSGKTISFFEADGEPLGVLRHFGARPDKAVHAAQEAAHSHSFALKIARGAIINRMIAIDVLEQGRSERLLYEGELDLMQQYLAELEYLVRVDEIRRVYRLVSDMYYEILARTVPGDLGFRRRTIRPHTDVVNSILSIGYGMLFGNICVAAIGSDLDPDTGFLHQGGGALVRDLMQSFQPAMIDRPALDLVRSGLDPDLYECGPERCLLSDDLVSVLIALFHASIDQEVIDEQVMNLRSALLAGAEFRITKF